MKSEGAGEAAEAPGTIVVDGGGAAAMVGGGRVVGGGGGSDEGSLGRATISVLQIIKRDTFLAILFYIVKVRTKLLPNLIRSNVT